MVQNDQKDLLYGDITEKIIKAAFEVYNQLGCGFTLESYTNALAVEFSNSTNPTNKLIFYKKQELPVFYKKNKVGGCIVDFIVEDKVVVKIIEGGITSREIAILINNLRVTEYKVGLLFDFSDTRLGIKRVIV